MLPRLYLDCEFRNKLFAAVEIKRNHSREYAGKPTELTNNRMRRFVFGEANKNHAIL